MKKVVIKIGTNVITNEQKNLDEKILKQIVKQVVKLKKQNMEVAVISSGAVAAGREQLTTCHIKDTIASRQVYASVGQITLMNKYMNLFGKHNVYCAQVLATREDFRDRSHYLNMKECFENLLHDNIVPIVNENDVVSVDQLMFSDNDELAGLIASMLNADILIILTSVDGLFDGNPKDPKSKLIHTVDMNKKDLEQYISNDLSSLGRGGMLSKCSVACKTSEQGTTTYIANGKTPNVIFKIIQGKRVGTKFPVHKKTSGIKRWLAHSNGHEKGIVYIKDDAVERLTSKKAISLLPIGITKVEGKFEKGDIIKIKDENRKDIGLGVASYDARQTTNYMSTLMKEGKKRTRPLIHYDYLYII